MLDSASAVFPLLQSSSPSAVTWLVIAIIIWIPIQRKSGWSWPHVFVEIGKRFPPSTYGYSSSPVIDERFVLWVFAARVHGHPNVVFSGIAHSVSNTSLFDSINSQASATSCCARFNVRLAGNNTSPAITRELINDSPIKKHRTGNSNKPSESHSNDTWWGGKAAAALGVSATKVRSFDNHIGSTVAATFPHCRTSNVVWCSPDNEQFVKLFSGEINNGHASIVSHWARQVGDRALRLAELMRS